MKKIKFYLKKILDLAILRPLLYIHSQLPERKRTTFDYVWERAKADSAEFVSNNISKALVFRTSPEIWTYAMSVIAPQGYLLEFGVYKGSSINYLSNILKQKNDKRVFYGFDSFLGLQEDWSGHFRPASSYSLGNRLPPVNDNVVLIDGMVQDTLLSFLDKNKPDYISFLHVDTDTYTPCRYVLEKTIHLWRSGTIILFDELIGYPGWKEHEYKAWQEILALHQIEFEYIAFADEQALVRITKT